MNDTPSGIFFTDRELGKKKWQRTGYFGHTPVSSYRAAGADFAPVRGEKIALVDTAVALSTVGMLSAICPDTGAIIQSNRGGETVQLTD